MSRPEPQALDPAVVDQAIHWLVRLRFNQADERSRRNFEHWLQQRPEHAVAWQRVAGLGDELAGIPPELARQTLAGASQGLRRRQSLKLLGLFSAVGVATWLARDYTPLPTLFAQEHSDTGELRHFQLDDGSLVQLNSDSAVDSHFDPQRRLITLLRGEIIVNVGPDEHSPQVRPFWVKTRDGLVRSHSPRFLVRERDDGTQLAVQGGTLEVFTGSVQPLGESDSGAVQAANQLFFTAQGPRELKDDGLDVWGWGDGVITAHDMRLGDFTAELARYRPGVLRCAPEVAERRISGTFQLADNDQVLALVAKSLRLRIDYRTRYWVTLSAAS